MYRCTLRSRLVAGLSPHLEWNIIHSREQLVHLPFNVSVYGCFRHLWLGAYWSERWVQAHWSTDQIGRDIAWKELFAIASAVNTWGHHWPRKKVSVHCDKQAAVDIWKKGSTVCSQVMALVRMLYFCAAQHNIHIIVTHIDGTNNCIADALSRFQVQCFHRLDPEAANNPDTIRAWPIQFLRDSLILRGCCINQENIPSWI